MGFMTNRRELADRLEGIVQTEDHERWCQARSSLGPCTCGHDDRTNAAILEAARLLREPVAGELEELRAVRDALMNAGGASPSDGMTRFSFWSLDKLAKAFDLAVSSLRARLDDEVAG